MTSNNENYEVLHDAWVSNSIPLLEKLLRNEPTGFSSYYIAGSLVIDMIDIRTEQNFVSFEVRNISELQPGDEWHQQYIISRMYVQSKKPSCVFYELAKANIKIFENV